jgi:NADPH:quinone reductase-like Zn-dependent oxidoreductase
MMMMNAWGILEKEKEVKIVHVQVERPCLLSHDHLIVKVHACAINPVDLHKIRARKEGLFIRNIYILCV